MKNLRDTEARRRRQSHVSPRARVKEKGEKERIRAVPRFVFGGPFFLDFFFAKGCGFFSFPGSFLFCFSAFLLRCFSASLLFCLLPCFSAFLLFFFSALLLLCFCFFCFFAPFLLFPECVARVPVSLGGLGVRLCSPKVAFATATVGNRPQPSATVGNRLREGRKALHSGECVWSGPESVSS